MVITHNNKKVTKTTKNNGSISFTQRGVYIGIDIKSGKKVTASITAKTLRSLDRKIIQARLDFEAKGSTLKETFVINNFEENAEKNGALKTHILIKNILNIEQLLEQVIPFEEERIVGIKERYQASLKDFENIDETRFYQEIAYFIEKLDISEEKVRLAQHLKYYIEVMKNEDFNGKKLGFIGQEIGREINTLGSKANHHEIQNNDWSLYSLYPWLGYARFANRACGYQKYWS